MRKNTKKKVMMGAAAFGVLALAAGTLALFSDNAQTSIQAVAGSLEIELSNVNLTNPNNINPGDHDSSVPDSYIPDEDDPRYDVDEDGNPVRLPINTTEHLLTFDVEAMGNKSMRSRETIIAEATLENIVQILPEKEDSEYLEVVFKKDLFENEDSSSEDSPKDEQESSQLPSSEENSESESHSSVETTEPGQSEETDSAAQSGAEESSLPDSSAESTGGPAALSDENAISSEKTSEEIASQQPAESTESEVSDAKDAPLGKVTRIRKDVIARISDDGTVITLDAARIHLLIQNGDRVPEGEAHNTQEIELGDEGYGEKTYFILDEQGNTKEIPAADYTPEMRVTAIKYCRTPDVFEGVGANAELEKEASVKQDENGRAKAHYTYYLKMDKETDDSYQGCRINLNVAVDGLQYRNTVEEDWKPLAKAMVSGYMSGFQSMADKPVQEASDEKAE